ncbi:MAG TPA: hypothetical protein PK890_00020 [Terrimesophilobacter sp.]|nr:hypothetical protein [Terrimesophilobacter sp.]
MFDFLTPAILALAVPVLMFLLGCLIGWVVIRSAVLNALKAHTEWVERVPRSRGDDPKPPTSPG